MEVIHEPKVVWNLSTKLVEMINEWLQGSLNSLARVINDDKVALDLFLADHLWVYLAMPQASGKVNTGLHGRKPPGFLMVYETSSASYSRAGLKLILPPGLFLMLGVLLIVS